MRVAGLKPAIQHTANQQVHIKGEITMVRECLHLAGLLTTGFVLAMTTSSSAQRLETGVPGMIFEHNVEVTMTDGLKKYAPN